MVVRTFFVDNLEDDGYFIVDVFLKRVYGEEIVNHLLLQEDAIGFSDLSDLDKEHIEREFRRHRSRASFHGYSEKHDLKNHGFDSARPKVFYDEKEGGSILKGRPVRGSLRKAIFIKKGGRATFHINTSHLPPGGYLVQIYRARVTMIKDHLMCPKDYIRFGSPSIMKFTLYGKKAMVVDPDLESRMLKEAEERSKHYLDMEIDQFKRIISTYEDALGFLLYEDIKNPIRKNRGKPKAHSVKLKSMLLDIAKDFSSTKKKVLDILSELDAKNLFRRIQMDHHKRYMILSKVVDLDPDAHHEKALGYLLQREREVDRLLVWIMEIHQKTNNKTVHKNIDRLDKLLAEGLSGLDNMVLLGDNLSSEASEEISSLRAFLKDLKSALSAMIRLKEFDTSGYYSGIISHEMQNPHAYV